MGKTMSELSPEINAAIMQYRNRCPDAYPDATSEELICSVLWSAGLFGRMAATRNQLNKELLAVLKSIATVDWTKWEDGYNTSEEFIAWARSIAGHTVEKAEGK